MKIHVDLPTSIPPWAPVTWWGWIGVQIFFVISGLVIAYSVDNATWRSFARRRVARLLPAMLICATFIALVTLFWQGAAPAHTALLWVKSVTFFPIGPWLAGQIWTLPVEVCFYGLVCLAIIAGQEERFEAIAWGLGALSFAYWAAVTFARFHDPFVRLTALALLQHGCYFAIGILISVIDRKGMTLPRALLATLCLVPAWLQIAATRQTESFDLNYVTPAFLPFAIWLLVCGLIAISVWLKQRIAYLLAPYAPTIRMIGLSTYPLYLLHMHAGLPLVASARAAGVPDGVSLLLGIGGAIGLAWVVAKYLEPLVHRPVTALLKAVLPDPH